MSNMFILWNGGNDFMRDGWSSNKGALSYQGSLVALSYRSEVLKKRVVVTTAENQHLIKLDRRMFIVPEGVMREAAAAIMQNQTVVPRRLPPVNWTAELLRSLVLPKMPHDFYEHISKIMRKKRRYIVMTKREPDEITKAMLSDKGHPWFKDTNIYTSSNEHDVTLFKLMSEHNDVVIDIEAIRQQAIEHYINIRDGDAAKILEVLRRKIALTY